MTNKLPEWMTKGEINSGTLPEDEATVAAETADPVDDSVVVESTVDVSESKLMALQRTMSKDIRSWGKWLVGLGLFHLIAAGKLDASWGVMLILLGAMSFLFTSPSMYVLYAVTMAWAGITNMLGGGWGWNIFALFQLYLAFKIGRQYYFFHKAGLVEAEREAVYDGSGKRPIAPRLFPWLGLIGGAFLLFLLIILFVSGVVIFGFYEISEDSTITQVWEFTLLITVSLSAVFWGINLASVLSKYRPRFLTGLGLFFSTVTVVILLILFLFV